MPVPSDFFSCSLLFFHANLFVAVRIHAAAACIRRVALAQQSTTRQAGNSGRPPGKQTVSGDYRGSTEGEEQRKLCVC